MQQLLSTAQQIMNVLNEVTVKTKEMERQEPKIREYTTNFRDLERLALRWLAIARRVGLPEDLASATQIISTLIVMVKMLEISVNRLSGGPLGVLFAIAGFVGVALAGYDMVRGGF